MELTHQKEIENIGRKPPAIYIVLGMGLGALGIGCVIAAAILIFSPDYRLQAVTYGTMGIIFVSISLIIRGFYNNFQKKIVNDMKRHLEEREYSLKEEKQVVLENAPLNIREADIINQLKVIRNEYSILENAYVASNVSSNEIGEIEKVLSGILSKGDIGMFFLLERLFEGITFSGNNITLTNWGEETWNELIKKQIIIKSLAAAKVKGAIPELERLSRANCNYSQWKDCIVGPLDKAIIEIMKG